MRIPVVGSLVQLTVEAYTIDEDANEVGLPAGTRCRIAGRRLFPDGHPQGLQFELEPLVSGLSFFIDETDLDRGGYPFELCSCVEVA